MSVRVWMLGVFHQNQCSCKLSLWVCLFVEIERMFVIVSVHLGVQNYWMSPHSSSFRLWHKPQTEGLPAFSCVSWVDTTFEGSVSCINFLIFIHYRWLVMLVKARGWRRTTVANIVWQSGKLCQFYYSDASQHEGKCSPLKRLSGPGLEKEQQVIKLTSCWLLTDHWSMQLHYSKDQCAAAAQ